MQSKPSPDPPRQQAVSAGTPSSDSKVRSKEPQQQPPAETYVGQPRELYEFLRQEYQKRRGIAFAVGCIHFPRRAKIDESELELKKKAEAEKRASLLVEFWEQYFLKRPTGGNRSIAGSREESKRSVAEGSFAALREKVCGYTREEVAFILQADIELEITEAMAQAEKTRRAGKVLEEHGKIEEEKRTFQKALNLHFSFERENASE